MLKVWMLTVIFSSQSSGSPFSSQQYQFNNQSDCLLARDYVVKKAPYAVTGFCLQVDKQ